MNTEVRTQNGLQIAVVTGAGLLLTDAQSALDLAMSVQYQTDCSSFVLYKENIAEEFFRLSSGLAGEVLQKFINYKMRVAIVGDFSGYTSKPLHDFIYESNNGHDVFFVPTLEQALAHLAP